MKSIYFFKSFIICILTLFISTGLNAQDWPGWRGPQRDGKVKEFKLPAIWPDQLKTAWQVKVGLGDASPSLSGGKLYLHTKQENQETAVCLDVKTGKILWSKQLNNSPEVTGGARTHPGPRSTPTLFGGKMFTLGVGGHFNCLDAKTGNIIWKNEEYLEVPQFFTSASALIYKDLCIVHLGGKTGSVVAFKIKTGEIAWKIDKEPATYSSPVLMKVNKEDVIIVQTETDLLGISPKGELLWKYPTPCEQRFYNSTTPVVEGNTVYIVGQGKGTAKLDISKINGKWEVTETWRNKDFGGSFNTPVFNDGFLYGNEARLGKLYCLNASSGATAWTDTVTYNRFATTYKLGNIMLSQPANGKVIFYEANPAKYIKKAIYKLSDTETYASPVITGNKMFVKDKENLTCFIIE